MLRHIAIAPAHLPLTVVSPSGASDRKNISEAHAAAGDTAAASALVAQLHEFSNALGVPVPFDYRLLFYLLHR